MSPLAVGAIIFLLMLSGSILGLLLSPLVERRHLSNNYKELLRSARSMIVQLTAVTLGLLVAQSLNSFEQKSNILRNQAASAVALDHILVEYGMDAKNARDELHKIIVDEMREIQASTGAGGDAPREIGRATIEPLRRFLIGLEPKSKNQDYLKTAALGLGEKIIQARWDVYEQLNSNIQWPLLAVLVFWLVSIFFSFGVLTPPDWILMVGLVISALSLAAAMYLVLEMDMPYQGLITISSAPLRAAVDQIR